MQLWSQLCLNASLTINGPNQILICLSPRSSSNADIKTPGCIQSTCIEKIGITFHFSTCRRTKNPSWAHSVDEQHGSCYYSSSSSSKAIQDIQADWYEPWALGNSSVGTPLENSQDSGSSKTHCTSSLTIAPSYPTYATQEVTFESLVHLVDVSLRRMISDNKPVRPGGVVLSNDDGCPKLAGISPSLFSPGYLKVLTITNSMTLLMIYHQAVSQRTELLPIIAGSVSRVYRRTRSDRLRHQIRRIQEISVSNVLDLGITEGSDSMFPTCVEARLWFLTRSKLIDPLACKSLKPLRASNTADLGLHEMLDESVGSPGDVMLDGYENSILEACSDVMELDAANQSDLSLEHYHFSDELINESEEPFWNHSLEKVACETVDHGWR